MLNFFRSIDQASDKAGRVAFRAAGSMAKFLVQEFREHPVTTPIALFGAGLTAMEVYSISSRWDGYKRQQENTRQYAELAMQAEVELTIPEMSDHDR